eukprot:TRINITY_DN10010_c0_g1_i1.p1 TRINITY_DN10010_c0_g1~~TRINITY_DN10010_c0_g1_i1.p1  ORF type:complete len:190 (-),score=31.55 TRINITY_DN10010_c0_g1_i1:62-631(-)
MSKIDERTELTQSAKIAAVVNNPEPLGLSTRAKDIGLILMGTAMSGFLAYKSAGELMMIGVIAPIHAGMTYGISRSYFSTYRLAVAFTSTTTVLSVGATALIAWVLTPEEGKHTVLLKPVAWMIERVAVPKITHAIGSTLEIVGKADSAEVRVGNWVRCFVSVGTTAITGLVSMFGVNVFRAMTAKKFN